MKKMTAAIAALLTASAASATEPPTIQPTDTEDAVHSYILLDRTGSMSSIWDEALTSVNTYAKDVSTPEEGEVDDLKTSVTLAVFDAQDGLQFDVLRSNVGKGDWTEVTNDEASPRGMTPLFDAIGQIVSLAEKDAPEKAVIVVMTDGRENSSRELTKEGAKAALDRVRQKGWEVVFLGAEFASFDDAEALGNAGSKNMAVSADRMQQTMSGLAKKSRSYGKGEEAEIVFEAEDREEAGEQDVIQRKGQ